MAAPRHFEARVKTYHPKILDTLPQCLFIAPIVEKAVGIFAGRRNHFGSGVLNDHRADGLNAADFMQFDHPVIPIERLKNWTCAIT